LSALVRATLSGVSTLLDDLVMLIATNEGGATW
jgi:hypothetical protein